MKKFYSLNITIDLEAKIERYKTQIKYYRKRQNERR